MITGAGSAGRRSARAVKKVEVLKVCIKLKGTVQKAAGIQKLIGQRRCLMDEASADFDIPQHILEGLNEDHDDEELQKDWRKEPHPFCGA